RCDAQLREGAVGIDGVAALCGAFQAVQQQYDRCALDRGGEVEIDKVVVGGDDTFAADREWFGSPKESPADGLRVRRRQPEGRAEARGPTLYCCGRALDCCLGPQTVTRIIELECVKVRTGLQTG